MCPSAPGLDKHQEPFVSVDSKQTGKHLNHVSYQCASKSGSKKAKHDGGEEKSASAKQSKTDAADTKECVEKPAQDMRVPKLFARAL